MTVQIKPHPGSKSHRRTKANRPKTSKPSPAHATPHETVNNAIPQKALFLAARLSTPPAISNEVPDEMPFPTHGQ